MAAWGWIERAGFVFPEFDEPLGRYPDLARWHRLVNARQAAWRARDVGSAHEFKREFDEQTLRALFPSNYAAEG